MGFSFTSPNIVPGPDIGSSTQFSWGDMHTNDSSTGDYTPLDDVVNPTPPPPSCCGADGGAGSLDLSNISGFTFTLTSLLPSPTTWGTFTASSDVVVTHTTNFLDVFIEGTFTPTSSLSCASGNPCDPTSTSLRFQANNSGGSPAFSMTMNSPSLNPPTPEPATLGLLGSALIGLGLIGRKRLAK